MAGSEFRNPAMNLWDAEWRRSVWRRWLGSRPWTSPPVEPPSPRASVPPPPSSATSDVERAASAGADVRRGEVRARFDALFDRLVALEDTLDALGKRFTLRASHERRNDQRLLERLESSSESLERQTIVLESVTASLERIEQRVERIERRLRSDGMPAEAHAEPPREVRDSRVAPRREFDEFEELEQALAGELRAPRATLPVETEAWESSAPSTASIRGNLSEMSLPTVLAMLELERRTGVLRVIADDGSLVSAVLKEGAIVGARSRDLETEPVSAIRESLRFQSGRFWFRQAPVEVVSGPPRSVGSVLLEATRQNDEALRSA